MRNVRTVAVLFAALIMSAACSSASPTAPSLGPQGPAAPVAGAHSYAITGVASTAAGLAVPDVAVGFKLSTAPAGCNTCDEYTAVTGVDGRYSVQLPAGTYAAACALTNETCQVGTNPRSGGARVTITVSAAGTLNLLVSSTVQPPVTPAPLPPGPVNPNPPPPAGDQGSTTVSGHLYTDTGQPVANGEIGFEAAACESCLGQPHTETRADGSYSITLEPGIYNAKCEQIGTCGVKGHAGPYPIQVPPSLTIDFVLCVQNQNCLN